MERTYICEKAEKLARTHDSRDPFALLDAMHVEVLRSDQYRRLKGYCALLNRSYYVMINDNLPREEQRIVAAHELGHIVLHKELLALAPMQDETIYSMRRSEEYEANLFAGDLLMSDEDVLDEIRNDTDMDIFRLCRTLSVPPELMNFKLFSMVSRGHQGLRLPMELESAFLGK